MAQHRQRGGFPSSFTIRRCLAQLAVLALMCAASTTAQQQPTTTTTTPPAVPSLPAACPPAQATLSPCLAYFIGNSSSPPTECCAQIRAMFQSQAPCLCAAMASGPPAQLGSVLGQLLPSTCDLPADACSGSGATSVAPVGPTTPAPGSGATAAAAAPETGPAGVDPTAPAGGAGVKSVPGLLGSGAAAAGYRGVSAASLFTSLLVVLALVVVAVAAAATLSSAQQAAFFPTLPSCPPAPLSLSPCIGYVFGVGSATLTSCCHQLRSFLKAQAPCLCAASKLAPSPVGLLLGQAQSIIPNVCDLPNPCDDAGAGEASTPSVAGTSPPSETTTTTPTATTPATEPTSSTPAADPDASGAPPEPAEDSHTTAMAPAVTGSKLPELMHAAGATSSRGMAAGVVFVTVFLASVATMDV
ncbi:hypothetical protein BAE44_0026280 [Dichanthelium oligosanthes]|uniref:Bifunctional inhibitor/plant lipid transfer protein/seed storage helical domain-containing protein n=1 Tax=Dichanthelium oligosanthes TaxID=888268 RepID=A0A1E5UIK8_9POAL|nr:hypothetical protein BAE44_0026280 [Dichanthelium oligosanthes]